MHGKPTLANWLSPWLAGVPLTALKKKDLGVHPIAVVEILTSIGFGALL